MMFGYVVWMMISRCLVCLRCLCSFCQDLENVKKSRIINERVMNEHTRCYVCFTD